MSESKKRKPQMGFKQAMEYVLNVLCYSYYVKSDNLVSDKTFDELEKVYCDLFGEQHAPRRAQELIECYSKGVIIVYELIKQEQLRGIQKK